MKNWLTILVVSIVTFICILGVLYLTFNTSWFGYLWILLAAFCWIMLIKEVLEWGGVIE